MPQGAGTLRNSTFWPSSGASSCHLPGVPLSPLYHANFSRDNFSTMSPPARTETLYGAGPREAAALPRRTKALCCCEHACAFQARERRASRLQPRRGDTWSAASWRRIKLSIPGSGGGAARKTPEAACAGSRSASAAWQGARGSEEIQIPELEHLIRLISSRTNVPPRGRLLGTKIIL